MRPVRALLVAALLASGAVANGTAASDVGECVETDPFGFCVEWDVPTPGGPGQPGTSGGEPSECVWSTLDYDPTTGDLEVLVRLGLAPPPEGVEVSWQAYQCSGGTAFVRWIIPATPANLAAIARGRLVGRLPQPVVSSSPPLDTASIVGVPVFVEVTNWTGEVSESECAGGLCVTVSATPALQFSPGETDSSPVACAGAGSRYVPGGEPVEAQASVPGACAYTYQLRTGVPDRPAVWSGEVSVTWTLSWVATSGASGSLPSVTRAAGVPRAVSEVQTVVVGGVTP